MAYKIIHTADWHLGQSFKQKSRIEEHKLFIHWLLSFLETNEINALLIAGDVFDLSNPSIEALDLYHFFLKEAIKLEVEVIVTGGNHDSAARLNTTGGLLKFLNVHVVGGGDPNQLGKIIPLKSKKTGRYETVVVAVPYLREGELRKMVEGKNSDEERAYFSMAVKTHYDQLIADAKQEYPNLPIITTGHLYVTGSVTSNQSEPSLHAIGTLGNLPVSSFDKEYIYVALGHIHKPQEIKHPNGVKVKYAGAPIPLSFSEINEVKEITIINIENGVLNYQSQQIPTFRILKRFKGSASDIISGIDAWKEETTLPTWVEIIITERINFLDFNKILENSLRDKNIEILSRTIDISENRQIGIREQFLAGTDQNPLDDVEGIFKIKCQKSGIDEENIKLLLPLFHEALNESSNKISKP